jgi:carbamoyl-phosphate synthase large subunit
MSTRLLVTGAGGAAAGNLIRDLRLADSSLVIVGCHDDRFTLAKSSAVRNWLVHAPGHPGYAASLRRVIERERVDVVIPTTDPAVLALARAREALPCRLFLPALPTIALCQDKYALSRRLTEAGVPAPETYPLAGLEEVEAVFARLARHALVWCRVRHGAGSVGAIPVRRPEQARAWIAYWDEMRGVPPAAFTLSEYLPGRDFSAHSLWRDGQPLVTKTTERLSYFVAGGSPSGISSVSALSKTGQHPEVARVCVAAIRAVDPRATGVFNLDLKENAAGVACVTEINAGRFSSGPGPFDLTGKHHLSALYVRLALGEPIDLDGEYDAVDDVYALRDLDTEPGLYHADRLFEGIEDAREADP